MNILSLFTKFINSILSFKLFDIEISAYLITITAVTLIFAMIKAIVK